MIGLDELERLMEEEMAKRQRNPFYRFYRWIRRWQPFYWFRAHTYNRYHIVNCGRRDNPAGYRWGWSDVDHLLLYAAFELLRRFVEDEDGLGQLAFQGPAFREEGERYPKEREKYEEIARERDAIYQEVQALWDWWTSGRNDAIADYEKDYSHEKSEVLYAKDTEMIIRLAKVRGSLWT